MNCGFSALPELQRWVDIAADGNEQGNTIDALFGCSSKLPRLMVCFISVNSQVFKAMLTRVQRAAAELASAVKNDKLPLEEIQARADVLQEQIRATEVLEDSVVLLGILCQPAPHQYSTTLTMDKLELRRRMVATAEIFRHASHIYVFRTVHGTAVPLSEEVQQSLETALGLLPLVPDALGPGANLGWCLVVLGGELDLEDQRDYIRSRWTGLHLLGMYNTKNGSRVLEEVWSNRDRVGCGLANRQSWQDVMQNMGESHILI